MSSIAIFRPGQGLVRALVNSTRCLGSLPGVLAATALLCLAAPAWSQESVPLEAEGQTPDSIETQVRAKVLMDAGRHVDALAVLAPLVEVRPIDMDAYFLVGLAAIGAARDPGLSGDNREVFLDIAVRTFRAMLVRNPALIRVRLELARAYFLKEEDSLAREQFERVLAGDNPPPVVANVTRYLAEIRKRRRWTTHFGFALAPDSNLTTDSGERTVNIFGLPFQRDAPELVRSGVGLSLWGGGEYQHPLRDRVRLRLGGDASRQEYSGSEFDRMSLSLHAGPRWLIGNDARASVLAVARHQRRAGEPYSDDLGINTEAYRRFDRRTTGSLRTSWVERRHDRSVHLDGPRTSLSVTADRVLTPAVRGSLTVGWSRERTDGADSRSTSRHIRLGATRAFAGGLTAGLDTTVRWTDYDTAGQIPYDVPSGEKRKDRTRSYRVSGHHRAISWRGFSPRASLVFEERDSNAQLADYERTFGEVSLVRIF